MFEIARNDVIKHLKDNSVNLQKSTYKKSEEFLKIRNHYIWVEGFSPMPIGEYIERYLLTTKEVVATYESIYDMGNIVEFDKEACKYNPLAKEIIKNIGEDKEAKFDTKKIMRDLIRKTGLIDRLKKYLNFDIGLFCKDNIKYQREIFKILYFFYIIENSDENKKIRKKMILQLLSKYSMENLDGYFINKKTYNGVLVKKIKNSLEKELEIVSKENIRNSLIKIQSDWNTVLEKAYTSARVLKEKLNLNDACLIPRIDLAINFLQSPECKEEIKRSAEYKHSPIETLYLKVLQSEHLGCVKDFVFINDIQYNLNGIASTEFIKKMKALRAKKIMVKDISFKINYEEIARFVYLKSKPTKTERERIKDNIGKVVKLYRFFKADTLAQPDDSSRIDELFIVSCLQAIILDKKGREVFDYTFHNYQEEASTRKPTIQGALLGDKRVYEALKYYWIRRVMDRWYSNCGMHETRGKLRELEKTCDNIRAKILLRPNVDEMLDMHNYYIAKVISIFGLSWEQSELLAEFEKFLRNNGFKYIDDDYLIRYVFLYSKNLDQTYNELINIILLCREFKAFYCFYFQDSYTGIEFNLVFDCTMNTCTMKDFKIFYDVQYIERLKILGLNFT